MKGETLAATSLSDDARLESAIAGMYGGPLEDFVRRRGVVAKELRSAGERDAASAVKSLRKPSRLAWALDLGALDDRDAIESLVAAVGEMLAAQSAGGDVRAAIAALRAAVREFAVRAADAAERAGHRVEPGVLSNAVLAVIGSPDSFEQLRGGRLADVPEAGGLEFLASLPTPSTTRSAPDNARESSATASSPSKDVAHEAAAREAGVREAARQTASALIEARERSEVAQRALRSAESKLHIVEERLRQADEEARAARDEHERAHQQAESAAAHVREAERAAAGEGQRRVASGDATRAGAFARQFVRRK